MSVRLKQIRNAIFGPPLSDGSQWFVSKSLAKDIEQILPGQTLTFTVKERQFVLLEREEFEVLIAKAGFTLQNRSDKLAE